MKKLSQKLNETSIKLDEWYECLPFEALNEIHNLDIGQFPKTDEELEETLDDLRMDWHFLPLEDKADFYDSLSEQYKSYANYITI
jgi:hypothetical protein